MFENFLTIIKENKNNIRKGAHIVFVFAVVLIIAVALSYLFGKQTDDNSGLGGSQATTTSLTNEEKRIIEEAFVQSAVDGAKNVQKSSLEKKFKSAPENTLSEEEKQNIENNFNSNINSN